MSSPQETLSLLQQTRLFSDWKKEHNNSYLTHFFSQLNWNNKEMTPWELGFFEPEEKKITVFIQMETEFGLRAPEKAFQDKKTDIEELSLNQIEVSIEQALITFEQELKQRYPQLQIKQGFVF